MADLRPVEELGIFSSGDVQEEALRERLINQITEQRAVIERIKGDWLNNYEPNPVQWDALYSWARFLYMSGGNQLGKSWFLRFFLGWTLSQYPKGWRGKKLMGDIDVCCGSLNSERLYSNVSRWLFGPSQQELGSGFIPSDAIDPSNIRWDKRNPDMVRSARLIRRDDDGHFMGYARVLLWAYTEQFPHGDSYDLFALDEEFSNQQGYYPSIIARLVARKGMLRVAATPEHGMTEMYRDIKHKSRRGDSDYKMIYYGVDDADHLDDDQKAQYKKDYKGTSEYQLRVYGKPIAGIGAAFDVDFTELVVPGRTRLADHFREIIGIDIPHVPQGIFAAVKIAYSDVTDEIYVLESVEIKERDYAHHIAKLRDMGGDVIPIAWPADATNRVVHGESFRDFMLRHGLNAVEESAHELHFSSNLKKLVRVTDVWSVCQDLQRRMMSGSVKFLDTGGNEELIEQLSTFEFDENRKANKHQIDDVADAFLKAFMMRRMAAEMTTVTLAGENVIIDGEDWSVFE